jgi:hypothetical protein
MIREGHNMGYYYDWIDRKWEAIDHDRKLTVYKKKLIAERGKLIENLIDEIERMDGVTGLYAQLLARALVKKDQLLMREYGERIANFSPEQKELQQ